MQREEVSRTITERKVTGVTISYSGDESSITENYIEEQVDVEVMAIKPMNEYERLVPDSSVNVTSSIYGSDIDSITDKAQAFYGWRIWHRIMPVISDYPPDSASVTTMNNTINEDLKNNHRLLNPIYWTNSDCEALLLYWSKNISSPVVFFTSYSTYLSYASERVNIPSFNFNVV